MNDALGRVLSLGDTVVFPTSGNTAARFKFGRVRSLGESKVVIERIDGHHKTLNPWETRAIRSPEDVMIVKI